MNIANFALIKYMQTNQYLNDFMSGSLYMNSLYNFWADSRVKTADKIKTDYIAKHPEANPDNVLVCTEDRPDLQEDTLEGITGYTEKDIHLDKILGEHVFTDYLYRPVGMKYCNVLCFYTIRFTIEMPTMLNLPRQERNNFSLVGYDINDNMQGLGKYIAIITDLDEFIRRVRKKVDENNFIYAAGPVHYNRMKCKGEISSVYEKPNILIGSDDVIDLKDLPDLRLTRDCFNKDVKYKSQNEWRIALYRGSKDTNAYRLEVGDLSDIVVASRPEKLNADIERLLKEKRFNSTEGYFGDRSKLRSKFLELGDSKVNQFVGIG